MQTSITTRLSALFASIAVTFAVLALIDDLAQPAPASSQIAARTPCHCRTPV